MGAIPNYPDIRTRGPSVASAALLSQRPGGAGDTVHVDGTYGGGAEWLYRTGYAATMASVLYAMPQATATAAGLVLASGSGFWERPWWSARRMSVLWAGAVADGVTDDRPAIQATADAVHATGGAQTCYAPAGRYLIGGTSTDSMIVNSFTTVEGDGRGTDGTVFISGKAIVPGADSTTKTGAPLFRTFNYRQASLSGVEDIRFKGIRFEGPQASGGFDVDREHYHAIGVSGVEGFHVEDCHFENFYGDAVSVGFSHTIFDPERYNRRCYVHHCSFDNNRRGAVTYVSCKGGSIHDNDCTGVDSVGIHLEPGNAGSALVCENVSIFNNVLHGIGDGVSTHAQPLWLGGDGLKNIHVYNNHIEDCHTALSFMFSIGEGVSFTGNTVRECSNSFGVMLRSVYGRTRVENNDWFRCSVAGAAFIEHKPFTDTSDAGNPDYVPFTAASISNNFFWECSGPDATANTTALVRPIGSTIRGLVIAGNVATMSGFYYGIIALDVPGVTITDNILDTTDGARAIFGVGTADASLSGVVTGNQGKGWSLAGAYRPSAAWANNVFVLADGTVESSFGGGSGSPASLYAEQAWNPPDLAAGASQAFDMTVAGANAGDIVLVESSGYRAGTIMWGEAIGGDTVRVFHYNPTAAAVNVPSSLIYVEVRKRPA